MSGLDRLRKVAKAATPGPWDTVLHEGSHGGQEWWEVDHIADLHASVSEEENATHIATFDPPTVLALLDVAQAAEAYFDGPCSGSRLQDALDRLREVMA